jgi:programmed cell death protein 4
MSIPAKRNSDRGQKGSWDVKGGDDGSTTATVGPLDEGDATYDSDAERQSMKNVVLVSPGVSGSPPRNSYLPEMGRVLVGPPLTLTEFKRRTIAAIEEYFSSGDADECLRRVRELRCPDYHFEMCKRAVSMSLDRNQKERELASQLLARGNDSRHGERMLTVDQVGKGFERLFEQIDDLTVDVPAAPELLAVFLGRAVVDEVLPPSFLSDRLVIQLGGDIVLNARRQLSREHASARLEKGWGPGDGRPTAELKLAVDDAMREYILSGNVSEATRCVKELRSPSFHSEVVKRAVVCAMDQEPEKRQSMSDLLAHLYDVEVLSSKQVCMGFERLRALLSDLILDTPLAQQILTEFIHRAIEDRIISPKATWS